MESNSDMLSRVCMMADGNQTWDLSDNDTRALRHVLAERDQFKQASELSDLRIRELEAQLAEARANLAKADNELNAAAYDLERQGRELADARLDSARVQWYFNRKNSKTVIGLELKWLQETDFLTYDLWAKDIDAAMKKPKRYWRLVDKDGKHVADSWSKGMLLDMINTWGLTGHRILRVMEKVEGDEDDKK